MNYKKGDLILVNTIEENKITCIVVSVFKKTSYLYAYCLESGNYRLVYEREVEAMVHEQFAPDFPIDSDFFNLDYSFYELHYGYNYTPFYGFFPYYEEDESEDGSAED